MPGGSKHDWTPNITNCYMFLRLFTSTSVASAVA
jgi:hypothetical protein